MDLVSVLTDLTLAAGKQIYDRAEKEGHVAKVKTIAGDTATGAKNKAVSIWKKVSGGDQPDFQALAKKYDEPSADVVKAIYLAKNKNLEATLKSLVTRRYNRVLLKKAQKAQEANKK